jgi:type IV fimbrial biogenesis protein FimT
MNAKTKLSNKGLLSKGGAGFTLIETMVSVAIVAVLGALAFPSFVDAQDRARIKVGVEAIYADMQYARLYAIKSSAVVNLSYKSTCWGISAVSACDCTVTDTNAANYCGIKREMVSNFKGLTMSSTVTASSMDGIRALVTNPGTVTFTSTGGKVAKVSLSVLGRPAICSTSGATTYVTEYKPC